MKGYLVKDYHLLFAQKNLFIIIPIGILFMFQNESPVMGISYILYVLTFLSSSVSAYDSFDNGMAYLMTMPGGRKNYVEEKYIFSFINTSLCAVFLMIIGSCLELFRGHGILAVKELILGTLLLYAVANLFSSIMIPFQLKFGHEKSRIALMIVFGIIFLGTMFLKSITKTFHLDTDQLLASLAQLSPVTAFVILALVVLGITAISLMISQRIMAKKSF